MNGSGSVRFGALGGSSEHCVQGSGLGTRLNSGTAPPPVQLGPVCTISEHCKTIDACRSLESSKTPRYYQQIVDHMHVSLYVL